MHGCLSLTAKTELSSKMFEDEDINFIPQKPAMLTCQACVRRYLRNLTGDIPQIHVSSRNTLTPIICGIASSVRSYTSNAAQPKLIADSSGHRNKAGGGSTLQSNTRQEWIESRGVRPAWKEKSEAASGIDRETALALRRLQDPLKMADYVRRKLLNDQFEEAQTLVRAQSKHAQVVVSWNHLISWQLSKGSLKAALKTYNEMKKRAQFPDGHTYSIIFNGCSMHPQPQIALAKALPIYYSMMSENSTVKPTVVHVNAVLKLCARALNTDAMLAIVAEMPSKGVGSPNNLTYTTIFNALRYFAAGGFRSTLTPMQKRKNAMMAMLEARRFWVDVTKRWGQGDIVVDEEMVSAFGRLLLLGSARDKDDILSLIEQTMNIPRQIPRLGTAARREMDPLAAKPEPYPAAGEVVLSDDLASVQSSGDNQLDLTAMDQFQSVQPTSTAKSGLWAKPGQNSLSLVLEALLDMKLKEPARKYWQIFTTQHNVQPDRENFNAYLRILRVARSSNEAVDVLLQMPVQDLSHSTFRIAMAACRRDKLNRNVFSNCGRLLDLMQTALRVPDIPFLEEYLELAITAPAYSKKVSSSGTNDLSKIEQGKQILRALERLNPSMLNLKALLHFEDHRIGERTSLEKAKFVDSILSLTTKMISSYDLLMGKAMVPRNFYGALAAQRSKLAAFVTKHKQTKRLEKHNAGSGGLTQWSADTLAVLASPEPIPSL